VVTLLDLELATTEFLNEREKKWKHDRLLTVGASEIGQCARRTWYSKKLGKEGWDEGYKPPFGAAARGDILEENWTVPIVRSALEKLGGQLVWAGAGEQVTIEVPEWRMSATPDGLAVNLPVDALTKYGVTDLMGDCLVVEMKSFDPRMNEDSLPKMVHVDQINAQMGLIRKQGQYAPAWGIIVYVNASFPDEMKVYPVAYNRLAFDSQVKRSIAIMSVNDGEALRPEGLVAGGKECAQCPFQKRCRGYIGSVPKASKTWDGLEGYQQTRIRSAVSAFWKSRKQIEQLTQKKQAGQAEIKEAMTDAGARYIEGEFSDGRPFKVQWRHISPRSSWDDDKVRAFVKEHGGTAESLRKTGKATDALMVTVGDLELE
jgi:CRISPR/Cas system-associated exonuclease Cas4 (RecB family)